MLEAIIKRLKSKTYWAAFFGIIITLLEAKYSIIRDTLSPEYREYLVMAWPLIMLTLREITNISIADK